MKSAAYASITLTSTNHFKALGNQFCVYTYNFCYVHLLFELIHDLVDGDIICHLPINDLFNMENIGVKIDAATQARAFKVINNRSIAAAQAIPSGGYYQLDIVIPRVR